MRLDRVVPVESFSRVIVFVFPRTKLQELFKLSPDSYIVEACKTPDTGQQKPTPVVILQQKRQAKGLALS